MHGYLIAPFDLSLPSVRCYAFEALETCPGGPSVPGRRRQQSRDAQDQRLRASQGCGSLIGPIDFANVERSLAGAIGVIDVSPSRIPRSLHVLEDETCD